MQNQKSDVVIIGGVATGPKTAATLARKNPDLKITVFEKSGHISFATCGMPYFASGDVNSFEELTYTSYGVPRTREFFKNSKGFDVVTGAEVTAINRNEKSVTVRMTETGETFEQKYEHLVIATGALPNKSPFPIPESDRISYFTRPEDSINFRRSAQTGQIGKAVIVGAGFIGCEMAEAVGGLWGIETVLIEKEKQLLPYVLDPEMSDIVKRELTKNDIDVRLGCTVEKIELDDDGIPEVCIIDGEKISADYVFLCLGVSPNTKLAKECGLETGKTGGILVNKHMQTSDPYIYAGGDCVESVSLVTGENIFMPMGSLANRHGRVIAENIVGNPAVFSGVTGAFLVKVFDLNVGSVGLSEQSARKAGFKANAVWGSFVDKPDYYPESKSLTLKMVYDPDNGRLLGLQATGAGDICRRIDAFSLFLHQKAKVDELLNFEPGYAPPYSEAIDPLHHLAGMARAKETGYDFVNPGAIADDNNSLWLDVREVEEAQENPFMMAKNPKDTGRYINVPLNQLRDELKKLDRNKRIILICRRGPRSYQAAVILKSAGFNDVHIIAGGTQAVQD